MAEVQENSAVDIKPDSVENRATIMVLSNIQQTSPPTRRDVYSAKKDLKKITRSLDRIMKMGSPCSTRQLKMIRRKIDRVEKSIAAPMPEQLYDFQYGYIPTKVERNENVQCLRRDLAAHLFNNVSIDELPLTCPMDCRCVIRRFPVGDWGGEPYRKVPCCTQELLDDAFCVVTIKMVCTLLTISCCKHITFKAYLYCTFQDNHDVQCVSLTKGIVMLCDDFHDQVSPLMTAFTLMPTLLAHAPPGSKPTKEFVAMKAYGRRCLKLGFLKVVRAIWPGNTSWHLTDIGGYDTRDKEFNAKRLDVVFSKYIFKASRKELRSI